MLPSFTTPRSQNSNGSSLSTPHQTSIITMASSTTETPAEAVQAMAKTATQEEADEKAVEELSQKLAALNTKVADLFSQHVTAVVRATVPDFPRLETAAASTLATRLERSYLRHVDVAEIYAGRNLFSLRHVPPNRRPRLAQLFAQTGSADELTLDLKAPPTTLETENHVENLPDFTKDPPPTQAEVQANRAAVQALRTALQEAQGKRAGLQRRVGELEIAQQLASWSAGDTTAQSNVQSSVTALLVGVHGLAHVQNEGQEALEQLRKRRRPEDDDEDALDYMFATTTTTIKSVQALYAQERKRVQTTTRDLKEVHGLLVGPPH
jgi:intracellular sulfur oxidation DsrE/DsrF family protein